MKICILITGMGMGGAEVQVAGLADALSRRGHEVLILGLTGPQRVTPSERSVRVEMLDVSKRPFSAAAGLRKLIRLLDEFSPDVVHSHMIHANLLARLLRLVFPMPVLFCTAHSNVEGGGLRMLAYRLTDGFCDISTNVSRNAVNAFIEKKATLPGRMVPVYNGVDTLRFRFDSQARTRVRDELGAAPDDRVMLAVGRLFPAKDYPTLLRAFAKMTTSTARTRLWIVGDGPQLSELEAMASHLGISDRVKFCGVRSDVPAIMSAADIFVLSSAWEGFGLVVAEALACGLPVVATDCGGVAEVAGGHAVLVPPSFPEALAKALDGVVPVSLPERESGRSVGRRHVEKTFALEAKVDDWLSLYRRYGAGDFESI